MKNLEMYSIYSCVIQLPYSYLGERRRKNVGQIERTDNPALKQCMALKVFVVIWILIFWGLRKKGELLKQLSILSLVG